MKKPTPPTANTSSVTFAGAPNRAAEAESMDPLLTVDEVAEVLRVQPWTVRKWLRDGQLRGIKVSPRVWRVRESDLQAFIEDRASGGGLRD